MDLPADDHAYLQGAGLHYEVFAEKGTLCVQFTDFPLPAGLNASTAEILLRLSPLYPDVAPDMWWTIPALTTQAGAAIPGTERRENHRGREWQRWSRHLAPSTWRPGIDGLQSYLALLRTELDKAAELAA